MKDKLHRNDDEDDVLMSKIWVGLFIILIIYAVWAVWYGNNHPEINIFSGW